MEPFAIGFMVVSMAAVTVLAVFCFAKILRDDK